jgi:hypothetical protein
MTECMKGGKAEAERVRNGEMLRLWTCGCCNGSLLLVPCAYFFFFF